MLRCLLVVLACAALPACKSGKQPGKLGVACGADAECASPLVCTDAPAGRPPTPGKPACAAPTRHYTFRAIAGVSMGAVGASRLAAVHPERFDAAGMLGGPLDATLLVRLLEGSYLAGFCSAAQLRAALLADQADGGNRLDREGGIAGCAQSPPAAGHYDYPNRYTKWHYTTNGGHFDRSESIDIFTDLMLALGNPQSIDPAQPRSTPQISAARFAAATCDQPAIVEHFIHPQYSPHGEYRAITFCDGEPPQMLCGDKTMVDWCAAAQLAGRKLGQRADADAFCASHGGNAHEVDQLTEPDAFYARHGELRGCWAGDKKIPFALALDMNGNGRRDYNEPVVYSTREPFDDVGQDGCADPLEDGKGGCTTADKSPYARGVADPNGDNYDPLHNPAGTEGNFRWDPGEPFQDVGLDGVAGTGDYGEGDGQYTIAPGLQNWFAGDLRSKLLQFTPAQLTSLDLYMEGGIRDVFDLGAQAEALSAGARLAMPDGVHDFLDFASIPSGPGKTYDPLLMNPAALGRNVFLPYGNPAATPGQMRAGDGDHVGTVDEVYDRFVTFFRWLSARWDPIDPPRKANGNGRADTIRYRSAALGADRDFVVTVPPGYDDPANAQKRYPVLVMGHGYGQNPGDMSGTSTIVDFLVNEGRMREIIIAYPDGRCCYRNGTGGLACTEDQAGGGYVRQCQRGSFFVNQPGPDAIRYGDSILELLDVVDQRYRTLAPADGPAF